MKGNTFEIVYITKLKNMVMLLLCVKKNIFVINYNQIEHENSCRVFLLF